MSEREEWGPWIEHDGRGCPLSVGVYFAAERKWLSGRTQIDEGVLTEEMRSHPSWRMTDEFGKATLVVRYRIRKPREMVENLPAPSKERVDA